MCGPVYFYKTLAHFQSLSHSNVATSLLLGKIPGHTSNLGTLTNMCTIKLIFIQKHFK